MAELIRHALETNRAAGLAVSIPMIRPLVLGYVHTMAPELLTEHQFKCSIGFLRNYLETELRWSWRVATKAAQKLPTNWEQSCEDMFLRIVHHAILDGIPLEAILNGDQYAWALMGAKQVSIFGKDEKRQFTLMITTSCSGEFLPSQTIWAGKTAASLPAAHLRIDVEREGNIFSCGGEKHWSTLACMKDVCQHHWITIAMAHHVSVDNKDYCAIPPKCCESERHEATQRLADNRLLVCSPQRSISDMDEGWECMDTISLCPWWM